MVTFKVLPCLATGVFVIDMPEIAVDPLAVLADVAFERLNFLPFEQKVNVFEEWSSLN